MHLVLSIKSSGERRHYWTLAKDPAHHDDEKIVAQAMHPAFSIREALLAYTAFAASLTTSTPRIPNDLQDILRAPS